MRKTLLSTFLLILLASKVIQLTFEQDTYLTVRGIINVKQEVEYSNLQIEVYDDKKQLVKVLKVILFDLQKGNNAFEHTFPDFKFLKGKNYYYVTKHREN